MNTDSTKPFQITEAMVQDFIRKDFGASEAMLIRWEKFKQSHSLVVDKKAEWEILSITKNDYGTLFTLQNDGRYKNDEWDRSWTYNELLNNPKGYSIHSVKRLSDGSIWTIGDQIEWATCNNHGTIEGFEVSPRNNQMLAKHYSGGVSIMNIRKQTIEPLFTTEDGVEIFHEHYMVWVVNSAWALMHKSVTQKLLWDDRPELEGCFKYFSTEEAANDYVNCNKPALCVKDIHTILIQLSQVNHRDINKYDYNEQIKKAVFNLVQSKLNNQ
jgi:hypothetical protein